MTTRPFDYAGFAAMAVEMIAAAGQTVQWRKPQPDVEGSDPWRDDRDGEPIEFAPKMVFLSPIDAARGRGRNDTTMFSSGTDVVNYSEVGLLAGDCGFVPEVTDSLYRNGNVSEIAAIDKIAPNGTPILYFIAVR